MGFLWDIIQQSQISDMSRDRDDLYARVADLEDEVRRTNQTLRKLVQAIESKLGEDVDGDGRVA